MIPDFAPDDELVAKIRDLLPQIPEGHPAIEKSLKESVDEFERLSRGKKLSQQVIDSLT